jgi:hypothetical protein
MPKKLTLSDEMRETDQLNVWCKICGELVAEVKVVHANKPTGFNPVRRKHMLAKINEQIEEWRQEWPFTNTRSAGKVEGALFVMNTIQGLFRDFELEKHPNLKEK